MGQGQAQDSQARTSRIQGCAYTMVLQAGLKDMFDVQGAFLLLHFLIGVLFNSDTSYSYLLLHHV